jgi:hypothetical protein
MAFQLPPTGVIQRLRAHVTFDANSELNVNASQITTEGIRIGLEGNATDLLPAMTSLISSPAPYLACTVTMPLIRPSPIAGTYKTRIEKATLLGTMQIIPDVLDLDAFLVFNTALETVREMAMSGLEAAMVVTLRGYFQVNTDYYNQ